MEILLGQSSSLSSLLGSILESALDKRRNVVLIVLRGSGDIGSLGSLSHHVLQVVVLLGSDLLEDLREQVLDFLGVGGTGHNEQVLLTGELDYSK